MRWFPLFVLSCALLCPPVAARPPHRQKRVSDQRLAELETLLALAKMTNRKYVTLPVGFGLIDVQQIGRRKRAAASPVELRRLTLPQDYDLSAIIADLTSALTAPEAIQRPYQEVYPAIQRPFEEAYPAVEELKKLDEGEGEVEGQAAGVLEPDSRAYVMAGLPRPRFI